MFHNVPKVGTEYVKLIETGEIVKWKDFDPKAQVYEVESSLGVISKIHGSKISKQVTPEEETEFLRMQSKKLNEDAASQL